MTRRLLASLALLLPAAALVLPGPQAPAGLRFAVSFPAARSAAPLDGRLLVLISTDTAAEPRFRLNDTPNTAQVFGVDVDGMRPGEARIVDATAFGYPIRSLANLPKGRYRVQALLNRYETFRRSDGHTVKLPPDQGEGQQWNRKPGNLYGTPRMVDLDPARAGAVALVMDQEIPPIPDPPETKYIKHVKIQSERLTRFWGRPMFLGAHVLLPEGFETHPNARYPLVVNHGHFPYDFTGFRPEPPDTTIPCEYSARFRGIGQGWARFTYGGSTGGWEAMAVQMFYPEEFNGAWVACPDPIDFRAYTVVNIYQDANAYYLGGPFKRTPRPGMRDWLGHVSTTLEQMNHRELARGTRSRSGDQWDIWEAVYSPAGPDGYPKPIWDKLTGRIDRSVAEYWREHYDLSHILRRDWKTLGPKLRGKLKIYVGDMDNYYLNNAVYLVEEFLKSADPRADTEVDYGDRAEHCWNGDHTRPNALSRLRYHQMFIPRIMDQIRRNHPAGADTVSWRY